MESSHLGKEAKGTTVQIQGCGGGVVTFAEVKTSPLTLCGGHSCCLPVLYFHFFPTSRTMEHDKIVLPHEL